MSSKELRDIAFKPDVYRVFFCQLEAHKKVRYISRMAPPSSLWGE